MRWLNARVCGGFLLEAAEEVIDLSDYPDAPMVWT